MAMNILSAYAVYNGLYHPMFSTGSGASTGLLRLGTSDESGNWTAHYETGSTPAEQQAIEGWLQTAREALPAFDDANADNNHDVKEGNADTEPPPDRVTKKSPWYAIFETDSAELIGGKELWVGRFMQSTASFGEPQSTGVFFFYQGQSVDGSADRQEPTLVAKRANRSLIFANFDSADDATAEAKEQGCHVEGSHYRNIWPVHD